MKEMNSLTHSCMHSLASFAIFAFSGRAVFMIRATGAKLRMLASDAALLLVLLAPFCGGDVDESGEDDMAAAAGRAFARHTRTLSGWRQKQQRVMWRLDEASAQLQLQWASNDAARSNRSTCRWERAVRKSKATRELGRRRTICYWEPSVLFLDLEFVPESLRLCILSVPVHMLVVVRRLRWFHTVLLWGGGRHVYSAGCRGVGPASRVRVRWPRAQ